MNRLPALVTNPTPLLYYHLLPFASYVISLAKLARGIQLNSVLCYPHGHGLIQSERIAELAETGSMGGYTSWWLLSWVRRRGCCSAGENGKDFSQGYLIRVCNS